MQWTRCLLLALVLLQSLTGATLKSSNGRTSTSTHSQEDRARDTDVRNRDLRQTREDSGARGGVESRSTRRSSHRRSKALRHRQRLEEIDHVGVEEEEACPECDQLQIRKSLRLAQIKDRVLTATGLMTPPNMTGVVISNNPDVQNIIELMETSRPLPTDMHESSDSDDEPEVKREKLFTPVEPGNIYTSHSGNS